jgi:AraC-like DNA-binding protein
LAAQYMLESDVCLADIALRCGFTDQAHFCKRFRQATGERPGSWRRAHRKQSFGYGAAGPSGEGMVRKGRPIEQSAMVAA